jgi:hypothetical protein
MSKRILLEEVEKELNANSLVFVKASRGMKLDVVYDEMILRDKLRGNNAYHILYNYLSEFFTPLMFFNI